MKLNSNFLFFLSASLALFAGCGGKKVLPEQSTLPDKYINPEFTPVPSVISVPVAIQPAFLENLISTQVKDTLYRNDSLKIIPGINIAQLKVVRAEKVHIGLLGDELHYRIPLKLYLRVGVGVNALGVQLYQDIEGGIALRVRNIIKIKENWTLNTQTIIDGYDWISNPVIKISSLSIPIKPAADLILTVMKGSLGKIVDKAVRSNLDLRKILDPLWVTIQKPMLLNDSLKLWLQLSPGTITMSQLRGYNGCIVSSIGITTVAETFWGDKPATDTILALPDLHITDTVLTGFVLNLYSEMPYIQAQNLARQLLCNQAFDIDGKKISIDNLWLNGDSGLIRIDADLSGAFKGSVSLIGQPYLDTATRVFSLEYVSFDMKTRNVLLATAKWMLNGFLQKKVAEALKFPLEAEIVKSRDVINESLTNYKP